MTKEEHKEMKESTCANCGEISISVRKNYGYCDECFDFYGCNDISHLFYRFENRGDNE